MKTIDAEDVWLKEVATSIKNLQQLKENLKLRKEENLTNVNNLPLRITPYFLNVVKDNDTLRRTVVPTIDEFNVSPDENEDPLAEDQYKKTDCIIHKYPDRVLFIVTNFCSTNCRYCVRSRIFDKNNYKKEQWIEGIKYISEHPEIRDVLISGGDPLTLPDDKIEFLLSEIKKIKHVEMIRIGTKVPVVLPSRINDKLLNILKKYHPLYLSIHFIHPDEITDECSIALNKIADCGIVMRSQTVLLKGINDDVDTMRKLMHKLLINRVVPYYIYQTDKILGSSHFRTSLDKGLEIISSLRGWTSGYAIPTYIIDTKSGKIPLYPDNVVYKDNNSIHLKSYNGDIIKYKTEDHKKKISESNKKIKMSSVRKILFIDPEGKEYIDHSLNQFCKDHNLCRRNVYYVLEGKYDNHKGWKIKYLD
jgi:lysine 2,3-aminomutase